MGLAYRSGEGRYIQHTPSAAKPAGTVIELIDHITNGQIAIPDVDLAADVLGEVAIKGLYKFTAKDGDTFAAGTVVYWDNVADEITTTSTNNCLAGRSTGADVANIVEVDINAR